MAALYDVPAPAKLNLFLHVVGRRADGYHLLQTVFRFVDLCDTLDFDATADGSLAREGEGLAGLAPDQDLVLRAARALQRATGARQGARIRYRKRIPAGGGLGGGSSDAATTLIALNRLWGTGLTRAEPMRLRRRDELRQRIEMEAMTIAFALSFGLVAMLTFFDAETGSSIMAGGGA